ncbi:hypothetical protein D3C80_450870 [compost metagenome]
MFQCIRQIGAAVPFGRLGRVRLEAGLVEEEQVPDRHRGADREGERKLGLLWLVIVRLHLVHEIGIERLHVVIGDLGIGRVRHCRIKMAAILGDPFTHGARKILFAVIADTIFLRRRDVGREDLAERRVDAVATGKGRAAMRRGVTGGTVGGRRKIAAARHEIGSLICEARAGRCDQRGKTENGGAERGGNRRKQSAAERRTGRDRRLRHISPCFHQA